MSTGAQLQIQGSRLLISGALDFDTVTEIAAEGEDWLRRVDEAEVHLDLSGVTTGNSAGVVLLLAWLRTARRLGKPLHIHGIPARLQAMMELTGLQDQFPAA